MQKGLHAAGQQVSAPVHQQNGVLQQSSNANSLLAVQNMPAPDSIYQEMSGVTAEQASDSTGRVTSMPTPTPSEQLADMSNFNDEVSTEKETSSSEDDEEEEDKVPSEQLR
jgi:hypothetical protein